MRSAWLISGVVFVLACGGAKKDAEQPGGGNTEAAGKTATAALKNAEGGDVGTATFTEQDGGVKVAISVTGLKPGMHGFHIHGMAKCEGPDFKSAGPHFNPHGKKHGVDNPDGKHGGDLPNIEVKDDGTGSLEYVATDVSLGDGAGSLFGPDGTALIIHADPDDGKTDPAGNAGARIACGVIAMK